MSKQPDLNRVIDLYKLLVEYRGITRVLRIPPQLKVYENDVEHSYNLAVLGWFLSDHFPQLDSNKVVKISIAHDLVEIYAGDTFVYDAKKNIAGKEQREEKALKRLKKEWRDFPSIFESIEEYKNLSSKEAKFVYALDKLIPAIMNYLGEGHVWHEHDISFKQVVEEKKNKIPVSPEIDDYLDQLIEILVKNPQLFPRQK